MPRNSQTPSEDEVRYKPRDGLHRFSVNNTMSWNWTKCRNCKGAGKTRSWDAMGREISVDTCPTCGGIGGWPKYTQEGVNSRLARMKNDMEIGMVRV